MGLSFCKTMGDKLKSMPFDTHGIIIFSVRCHGGEQVHSVISDSVLRDHVPQIRHVGIVSKCENSRIRDLGGQKSLWPWSSGTLGFPCPFTIAGKTVNKYNAVSKISTFPNPTGLVHEPNRQPTRLCCSRLYAAA
jgi:hypothetical protein